jgi:hypothetical protein
VSQDKFLFERQAERTTGGSGLSEERRAVVEGRLHRASLSVLRAWAGPHVHPPEKHKHAYKATAFRKNPAKNLFLPPEKKV